MIPVTPRLIKTSWRWFVNSDYLPPLRYGHSTQTLYGRNLDMKKALYKKIISLLDLDSARSYNVLDVGCGGGDFLGCLSETIDSKSTLVGIDEMEHPINNAKESYPGIEFHHPSQISPQWQSSRVDPISYPLLL